MRGTLYCRTECVRAGIGETTSVFYRDLEEQIDVGKWRRWRELCEELLCWFSLDADKEGRQILNAVEIFFKIITSKFERFPEWVIFYENKHFQD